MIVVLRRSSLPHRTNSHLRLSCQKPFHPPVFSQFANLTTYSQCRQRQYMCRVEAEDPHNYLKGVYFPVELNSFLKDGRYLVLDKLGWGGYATVWLARDTLRNSSVALKVVSNGVGTKELEIMRHLRDSAIARTNDQHPGRKFVAQLLDDFDISKSHKCLVLDVLGRSISSRANDLVGGRLPGSTAKEVTRQVALGLDYLWKCHVAHGDLYGGNILFTAPTFSALAEDRPRSYLGKPEVGAVTRLDGDALYEPSVPRYLVRPRTIQDRSMEIRIVDFGAAFLHHNPPEILHTPINLRAPEALFDRPLSSFVDAWSMGCLLFETLTGRPLISPMLADRFSTIEEIQLYIGPPPADWVDRLDDTLKAHINKGNLKRIDIDRYLGLAYDQDDAALVEEDEDDYAIEEYEKAPREFTVAELEALSSTLSGLLRYEPTSRNSPEDLLRHPWFLGQKSGSCTTH